MTPLEPPTLPPYFATGSLPRFVNRRPLSRKSSSLTRTSSVRTSWALNRSSAVQNAPDDLRSDASSSIAPSDSVSYGYTGHNNNNNSIHDNMNNKYNTLTPAEAKKLSHYFNGKQPVRTASVLRKPRAPPLVVTNLDDCQNTIKTRVPTPTYESSLNSNGLPTTNTLTRSGARSSSSCSTHNQRHSINLTQSYQAPRTINGNTNNRYSSQCSPCDSESNLSFRSSLDIAVDSAYGSDKLQTMSVDLNCPPVPPSNGLLKGNTIDIQDQNKISDDSYSSAKSHISQSNRLKSSLSASTSKVLQNPLFNIKRFLRYIPNRRSFMNNSDTKRENLSAESKCDLTASISQIWLTDSKPPTNCPPPPRELKSMSYMESAINYSNYDEFTKARNKQTSNILNNQMRINADDGYGRAQCKLDHDEVDAWQLTSLPVSYERNLTTVVEERQNQELSKVPHNECAYLNLSAVGLASQNNRLITPPEKFNDTPRGKDVDAYQNPSQSMTSIDTTDSALDYQRQTATTFRFSYAQPVAFSQASNNVGLPPRMPIYETRQEASTDNSSSNTPMTNGFSGNSHATETNHYGTANGLDLDTDATIISDTSTLHGDSTSMIYINKCSELERTVGSLKNKLVAKEKEITDLQLKQWSSDYLIDQLKSTINKLEKENAQLKSVMVKTNRMNS